MSQTVTVIFEVTTDDRAAAEEIVTERLDHVQQLTNRLLWQHTDADLERGERDPIVTYVVVPAAALLEDSLNDDDYEFRVVATFPDGSVIQRYIQDGQYWHVHPEGRLFPGEELPMKRAADRVVYSRGTVVLGVKEAKKFYAAVLTAQAERDAERSR